MTNDIYIWEISLDMAGRWPKQQWAGYLMAEARSTASWAELASWFQTKAEAEGNRDELHNCARQNGQLQISNLLKQQRARRASYSWLIQHIGLVSTKPTNNTYSLSKLWITIRVLRCSLTLVVSVSRPIQTTPQGMSLIGNFAMVSTILNSQKIHTITL